MRQQWIPIVGLLLATTVAQAQVYKCRQVDGSLRFSDNACAGEGQQLRESQLQPITMKPVEPQEFGHSHARRSKDRRPSARQRSHVSTSIVAASRRKTKYSDMPSASERMAQRREKREAERAARHAPDPKQPNQIINPYNGHVYPAIGGGNYIDPYTGTVLHGAAGGVINSKTGRFVPTN